MQCAILQLSAQIVCFLSNVYEDVVVCFFLLGLTLLFCVLDRSFLWNNLL